MKKTCLLLSSLLICLHLRSQNLPFCTAPAGAENCANACLHCVLNNQTGSTAGFGPGSVPGFCGSVENDQWLGFVAGANNITIFVTPKNCANGNGLEAALYQNCTASVPLSCAPGQSGGGNMIRTVASALVPGQSYFLMIDGFQGDQCEFTLSVSPAAAVLNPVPVLNGSLNGPSIVAAYSENTYSVAAATYATGYVWSGPPGAKINGAPLPVTLPAPGGNQAKIHFGNQSGAVCVQAVNNCGQSQVLCQNVSIGVLTPPCSSSNLPAADECADACVFCNFSNYSGSTAGYNAGSAPGFCGTTEADQWLGFIASQSSITIQVTPSNCLNGDGVQAALYSSCTAPPIVCDGGTAGGGNTPVILSASLMVGQSYFLMVDGFAGDECNFTVTALPPPISPGPLATPGPIQGPATTCPGATVVYKIDPVPGAAGYTWAAPVGSQINGQGSPYIGIGAGSNQVTITFGTVPGSFQIAVSAVNSCSVSSVRTKTIVLQPIPPTQLPPVLVCNEDLPYTMTWADCIVANSSGNYCFTFTSYLGCDSTVCQKVTVLPPILTVLPPKVLCPGGSFSVCGEEFSNPGSYVAYCESYLGCDSVVNFSIILLEPIAIITPQGSITCTEPPVVLQSSPSPGIKIWKNLNGTILGAGNSFTATTSGTYILMVTATAAGVTCVASDTITILLGTTPPQISATGGNLTCLQNTVTLNGSSNVPGALFFWSSVNGFMSTEEDPSTQLPGNYLLTVTNPQNGCTAQTSAQVLNDTQPPDVSVTGGTINCLTSVVTLACTTNASGATFSWSGPNAFSSTLQNPVVSAAGCYNVTVTGTNGCTATAFACVTENTVEPSVSLTGGMLSCNNPQLSLEATGIPAAGLEFTWQGPGGFAATGSTVSVQAAGTYIVTATNLSNGCTATAETTVAGDFQAPDASAAGGSLTCLQNTATLDGSSTTPGATFSWSGPNGFASTEEDPVVQTAGTYLLTVSNPQNGCTAQASAEVLSDGQTPDISVAGGEITCLTSLATLTCTTNAASASFVWSGPNGFTSFLQNPVVDEPGCYFVTLTDANGCIATGTACVADNTAAPALSVADGALNCSVPQLLLEAVSAPSTGIGFAWQGPDGFTATGQTVTVQAAGTYSVTATNTSSGCTATAEAVVAEDFQAPDVSASGGILTCLQNTVTLAGGSATPGALFSWSGPNGFTSTEEDPVVQTPGAYLLTVFNPQNGCSTEAPAEVLDDTQAPDISVSGGELTCLTPSAALQCTTTAVGAAFLWSGPNGFSSTLQNPVVNVAGCYEVVVAGSNGCTVTGSACVTENTAAPGVSLAGGALNCNSPSLVLEAISTPPTGLQFSWQGPGGFSMTGQAVTVQTGGTYSVTVTNPSNGCTTTAETTVTEDSQIPDLVVADDTLTCTKPTVQLQCMTSLNPQTAVFSWSGPNGFSSTLQNPSVLEAGLYTVVLTNSANGCTNSATATVLSTGPVWDISIAVGSGGVLTCLVTSIQLEASAGAAQAVFQWSGPGGFSASVPNPQVTVPGQYFVTVTDVDGCMLAAGADVLQDIAAPAVDVGPDQLLTCAVTGISLTPYDIVGQVQYTWTGPGLIGVPGNPPMAVLPGEYVLLAVYLGNGCSDSDKLVIGIDTLTPLVTTTQVTPDNGQGTGAIQISVNHNGPYTVEWRYNGQFFSNLQNIDQLQAGLYEAIVTGGNGCTAVLTVNVTLVGTREAALGSQWRIFPNPTAGLLHVRFDGTKAPETRLRLLDAVGRVVLETAALPAFSNTELSLEKLPAGVYTLWIQTAESAWPKTVVVTR